MHVIRLALVFVGRVDNRGLELSETVSGSHSQVGGLLWHCDILASRVGQAADCEVVASLHSGLRGPQS